MQWLGVTLELAHETQVAVDGEGLPYTKNAGNVPPPALSSRYVF